MMRPLVLIAAVARNGVIGRDNALPWRLPSDLKRFKALTLGTPMLMGRKTFASIGRPLPGRETVVLTRDLTFAAEGVHVAHDLEDALVVCDRLAETMGADRISVVGGAEIYALTLPRAARLEITHVECDAPGDAGFPEIDPEFFTAQANETPQTDPRDEYAMSFATYTRR